LLPGFPSVTDDHPLLYMKIGFEGSRVLISTPFT